MRDPATTAELLARAEADRAVAASERTGRVVGTVVVVLLLFAAVIGVRRYLRSRR